MNQHYDPPVSRLIELGESWAIQSDPWPDYLALGLTEAHIDELIRMAIDPDLNNAMSDTDQVWAPLHAWRALAQLGAERAAGPLTQLLDRFDEGHDDWAAEELPIVFEMIGPTAIGVLQEYLANPQNPLWGRVVALEGLAKIAQQYAHTRDECVRILTTQLSHFAGQDEVLNSFIISSLMDLKAVEALEVIKQAFDADCVDVSVHGDWEDVLSEMGMSGKGQQPGQKLFAIAPLPDVGKQKKPKGQRQRQKRPKKGKKR